MVPAAGTGPLATIQAALHIIGTIVLPIGIALALTGGSSIVVIVGSLVVLAAMALFAWIVFRTTRPGRRTEAATDDHDPAMPVA
jgi:hypothetical protein